MRFKHPTAQPSQSASSLADYLAIALNAEAPAPSLPAEHAQTLAERLNLEDTALALNLATKWDG